MNKPGILFKLKEWMTIPDAAKHLSRIFGEGVTPTDVLRLGLDDHLKISVFFVNHVYARRGEIVSYEEAEWYPEDFLQDNLFSKKGASPRGRVMKSLHIDDETFLNLEDNASIITGVWDLAMIGAEALDIEHEWQQLTGGPEVTLISLDGAFVKSPDNQTVCQLQESYDQNEFQSGSKAQLESLKRHIAENNLNKKDAEKLLTRYHENREKYLEKRANEKRVNDFYPAGGLPEDSVLVVRTQALMDLQNKVAGKNNEVQNELSPRAETAYLNAIGALLSCLTGDFKDNVFSSEAELREFIAEKYDGYYGLKARTLAGKFSLAKKSLADEL
jgi:hypothetical protein